MSSGGTPWSWAWPPGHRTVQNHVQNTLGKLQMHNRVELVRYAISKGLHRD